MHLKQITKTPTYKIPFMEAYERIVQIRKSRATPKTKETSVSTQKLTERFITKMKKLNPKLTDLQILEFLKGETL